MNSKRKSRNSSGASDLKSKVVIKGESLPASQGSKDRLAPAQLSLASLTAPLLTTPSPRGSTPNTPTATRDVIPATAHVIARSKATWQSKAEQIRITKRIRKGTSAILNVGKKLEKNNE